MTEDHITAKALEIRIGVSRRVRPMDVLPPEGYPEDRPYRWSEKTVLKRWRRRTASDTRGLVYRGSRLPPSLWALIARLRMLEGDLVSLDDATLGRWIDAARAEARDRGEFLAHVAPGILRALLAYLSPGGRLDAMLEAHADGSHGVPDLFLFRDREGKTVDAMFVEVKRHGEAVSEEQVAEITRLRTLGLPAGVFRFDREPTGSRKALRESRRRCLARTGPAPVTVVKEAVWDAKVRRRSSSGCSSRARAVNVQAEARSGRVYLEVEGPSPGGVLLVVRQPGEAVRDVSARHGIRSLARS